jgi:poly(A) polymerase
MLKRIKALFNKKKDGAESLEPLAGPGAEAARPPIHRGPQVVHRPIAVQDLDPDAVKIVRRLARFDHTAYLVGGCVRDLLLDRSPKDFDIGTSATPRQIKRLFRNCRIIGRRFRLAHIYFHNGKVIEVATFRSLETDDSAGGNGDAGNGDLLIKDDNVFGTPETDALRRDFTINQLFYDVNEEQVIDHADGLGDLRRRYVRAIGDPEIRFREDPIRILRAIKFAARLDFEIERETLEALARHREEIPKAAAPRILEEINRFCRGGAARRSFELMRETRVMQVVLPEFAGGYEGHDAEWDRCRELLDGIDKRNAEGHEVTTGAILAALMLPLLAERMGFRPDGTAEQPRGLKVREMADEVLQPLAQRLRAARKDQERCRDLMLTLFRMVPSKRVRRNTRRGILGRECLADALWMLEVWAARDGGEFAEALEYWKQAASEQPETGSAQRTTRRSRGGRRRGGSRQDTSQEGGRERATESGAKRRPARGRKTPSAPPKPDPDMPSPWDEKYFFAALPSVPDLEQPEGDVDRPADEAVPTDSGTSDAPADGAEAAARPRRRRRRRGGRGRGRSGRSGTASDSDTDKKESS